MAHRRTAGTLGGGGSVQIARVQAARRWPADLVVRSAKPVT